MIKTPCPFCESLNVTFVDPDYHSTVVWCRNCGAKGPARKNKKEALERWNNPTLKVEKLIEAVEFYADKDNWDREYINALAANCNAIMIREENGGEVAREVLEYIKKIIGFKD